MARGGPPHRRRPGRVPIGDRLGPCATRFVVAPSDSDSFHQVRVPVLDAEGHDHWQWANPQGVLLEARATGDVTTHDPSVESDGALPPGGPFVEWIDPPERFEAGDLRFLLAHGVSRSRWSPTDAGGVAPCAFCWPTA